MISHVNITWCWFLAGLLFILFSSVSICHYLIIFYFFHKNSDWLRNYNNIYMMHIMVFTSLSLCITSWSYRNLCDHCVTQSMNIGLMTISLLWLLVSWWSHSIELAVVFLLAGSCTWPCVCAALPPWWGMDPHGFILFTLCRTKVHSHVWIHFRGYTNNQTADSTKYGCFIDFR